MAGLARLRLGQAEARHVRRAERRARDVDVLEPVGLHARRVLDRDDALVGRLVGERRTGDEIADRVDAVGRRAHAAVDLQQAALVDLDARVGQAEHVDVGAPAGGDDQPLDLAGLVAEGELHAGVRGHVWAPDVHRAQWYVRDDESRPELQQSGHV